METERWPKEKQDDNQDLPPPSKDTAPACLVLFHPSCGGAFHVMTYPEKLQDPRWQKFSLQCLESANWRCEHCGSQKGFLHVHHMFYAKGREPWSYPPGTTVVLCQICHDEWHANEYQMKVAIARALRLVSGRRLAKVVEIILKEVE